MGAVEDSVTVIVHGTFAEDETWWKPSPDLPPSAADDLEKQLRDRGMAGSVWRGIRDDPPVHINLGDAGAQPVTAIDAAFGWSGKNLHDDRVGAATKLRTSLEALADRREPAASTGERPRSDLGVHIVAHSHGGNIVLEMMKQPPRDVDLRSITMLGTPLIWQFRAFRLFRILLAVLFVVALAYLMIPEGDQSAGEAFVISGIFLLAYPWLYFWVTRLLVMTMRSLDAVWRHVVHGGRSAGQPAYGPRPSDLREQLGRPILLLRSAEDEADLMMHFGASPIDAYQSLVRPKPPNLGRGVRSFLGRSAIWLVELLVIRPWVYILFVPMFEAGVEHYGIGFPWSISMWRNQEMVSQRDRAKRLYPAGVVNRVDVTGQLLPTLEREIKERAATAVYIGEAPDGSGVDTEDGIRSEAEHLEALKATFTKLRLSLIEQFNLRHSMYYESEEILAMVADEIVAAENGATSPHLRPESVAAET